MTLWVHVHGGYASYEGTGAEWGQQEYDAFKLVQTLKGNPINGYATLRKANGTWVKITTENPAPAFELWREWAAPKARSVAPRGTYLVPVPSSDCLEYGADAKGRALAEAIAASAPEFEVCEALRWKKQYPKASQGGPRDFDMLFENIRVRTGLPARTAILIDDVVTGGGHLRAAAAALRWAGHTVTHAICVAKTVHEPPTTGMFNLPVWDAEAGPFDNILG